MLQLENKTPFAANFTIYPNSEGVDTLYVVVKASFEIQSGRLSLSDEQYPPQASDVYFGDPSKTSLKFASDFLPSKTSSDVVILGEAMTPEAQAMYSMDVKLKLAGLELHARIFGDRVWERNSINTVQSFSEMPIIYENAFGGCIENTENPEKNEFDSRNPVGKGLWSKDCPLDGLALPNVEWASELISNPKSRPYPAGFGMIAPSWMPRVQYTGTYDEVWSTTRAPFLPTDYDGRFANVAHPKLIYPGFLQGGEPILISGMSRGDVFRTSVPAVSLSCHFDLERSDETRGFNLETLILEPNRNAMQAVWKSQFICNRANERMKSITVNMSKLIN